MPEFQVRVTRDIDDHVATIEAPDWLLAFIVDVHRAVSELHSLNATLMQIAKRDIERKRTVSGEESCSTT